MVKSIKNVAIYTPCCNHSVTLVIWWRWANL